VRHYSGSGSTKTISYHSRYRGRDLNPEHPAYDSEVLSLDRGDAFLCGIRESNYRFINTCGTSNTDSEDRFLIMQHALWKTPSASSPKGILDT
jgi:hypothetical protein